MGLAKLAKANVLPTMHSSLNTSSCNLGYIKVYYRLYKKLKIKLKKAFTNGLKAVHAYFNLIIVPVRSTSSIQLLKKKILNQ